MMVLRVIQCHFNDLSLLLQNILHDCKQDGGHIASASVEVKSLH